MSKNIVILLLLCVLGGLIQNRHHLSRWWHPPMPVASGEERVVMYATRWCGYCAQARRFFVREGIAYVEFDIETSDEGRAGYERLRGNGVPVIVIDGNHVIRGFNPDALRRLLNR